MMRQSSGQTLSAVFVDYDNIYLSLKRKNEEAAKRFAKDAGVWLAEIESGGLITPTNKLPSGLNRRIVLNRCYGNPVPRRNQHDNTTDMSSFPFVRHHFLRSGFEIVDCPPLTAQLKNSSDIRMVMDVRDYLHHDTYFDEFVILSGDADFTPVLHRLRAHARRTVVYANEFTAAPYVAIADGEIRETDLIAHILGGKLPAESPEISAAIAGRQPIEEIRRDIITEIASAVRSASAPIPLEALAERATRMLGHERTVGTNWAGAGSFRELLLQSLPEGLRLSDQPPYVVFDAARQGVAPPLLQSRGERPERAPASAKPAASASGLSAAQALSQALLPAAGAVKRESVAQRAAPALPAASLPAGGGHAMRESPIDLPAGIAQRAPATAAPQTALPARTADTATALQQSIARIHEASQAPPLSPPEYRQLFEVMAQEINESGLQGAQTLASIGARAHEAGLDIRRDDIRFVLDVVSEADPWFEQGASANLFAGRFRNFVVARCRGHGLNLSPDEIDLIDAWFTGAGSQAASAARPPAATAPAVPPPAAEARADRWWAPDSRATAGEPRGAAGSRPAAGVGSGMQPAQPAYGVAPAEAGAADEFPRIVRTRLRG